MKKKATKKSDRGASARKASPSRSTLVSPRKASEDTRSDRSREQKPDPRTSELIADAFRRGQDEKVVWYEQHIREQFVEGPGGTKWLLSQVPEHIRKMETSASQAIRTHFEAVLSRLPAPATQQEKWVPKVGEWVMKSKGWDLSWNHHWPEDGPRKVATLFPSYQTCKVEGVETVGSLGYLPNYDRIRPATPAEVQAHQQAEKEKEWSRVEVLQEGDACDIENRYEFLAAMRDLGLPTGAERTLNGDGDCTVLEWTNDRLFRHARATKPLITTDEFLRRANGTIARKEEQDAKLLVFGARVKCGDREGIYLWKYGAVHRIALGHDNDLPATVSYVNRREFTIITPEK